MSSGELNRAAKGIVVFMPDGGTRRFVAPFHIGRDESCDVQISDSQVSRHHARVARTGDQWVIADLQSSNGLFVDGRRVDSAPISGAVRVRLGGDGPELRLAPDAVGAAANTTAGEPHPESSVEHYAQRYLRADDGEQVGSRTLMIRKAFEQLQQRQRRRTALVVAAVAVIALAAASYAW